MQRGLVGKAKRVGDTKEGGVVRHENVERIQHMEKCGSVWKDESGGA